MDSQPAATPPLLPEAGNARSLRRKSSSCSVCGCLCACFADLLTCLLLLIIAPILLVILFLFCLIPILDRLLHPCRKYMDGTSSAYINHIDEGVIHGIVVSKARVTADVVFAKFDQAYVNSGRPEFVTFKQRMVRSNVFWPYWTDAASGFDTAYHFREIKEPITKEQFEERLAQIQTELMDFERPLWQLWHFENYIDEEGKQVSATMLRIHHAVCDGFTGLRMMMQGAQPNKPPPAAVSQSRGDRRPRIGICQFVHYWLASMRKLLFMQADNTSAFKSSVRMGPPDKKHVAWSTLKHSSVASLKQLGKSLGNATINDILMAAFAGALRRHAQASQTQTLPNDLTACAWVSQSPLKHIYSDFSEVPFKWGNATLGAFYVPLPVGMNRGQVRARDTLGMLQQHTTNPQLMVEAGSATKLLGLFGWLPRCVGKLLWGPLANKVSVSMSNVPGPQFAMEWVGVPVQHMMFFVPPTGTISLFCTIATWDGEVNVGMGIDAKLIEQKELLAITGKYFEEEIEELRKQAGQQA